MKKLYFVIFITMFSINNNFSQIINIPDPNFKNTLLNELCADTDGNGSYDSNVDFNNDGEIDVTEAAIPTRLNLYNRNINSMIGIEHFVNLEYLLCSNNPMTHLDLNNLQNLTVLTSNNGQLESIEIEGCLNLGYINLINNKLESLSIRQENNQIEWLNCSSNLLTTLDLNSAKLLEYFDCSNNQLTSLFIKNGSQEFLFGDTDNFDTMNFSGNPNLEYICCDEADLVEVEERIVNYNISNCEANTFCSFVPGGDFYTLQGNVKIDFDENGCLESDVDYSNLKFMISNNQFSDYFYSDINGSLNLSLQEGEYLIQPILESTDYFDIIPQQVSVNLEESITQDFCVTPNGEYNDLEVRVIPITQARPGFEAIYRIVYKNKGTTTLTGKIDFDFSDNIDETNFLNSTPIYSGIQDNIISWNYENLQPFEERHIDLTFQLNTPTDPNFPLNDGDVLSYFVQGYPFDNDNYNFDNSFSMRQIVVNSYDPNDITCIEGETVVPEMAGEYLHYIIRFENLGTAAATNIVVLNSLDLNRFDVSSLIPLNSSHDFDLKIEDDNQVKFIFENINLPFDDDFNDGYVTYKVKTLSNLIEGDEIDNSAEIYFDYNFPIYTNTYTTSLQSSLSLSTFEMNRKYQFYPNPVESFLQFISEDLIKSIKVYDINNKLTFEKNYEVNLYKDELNFENLIPGVYFIQLTTVNDIFYEKVVVK